MTSSNHRKGIKWDEANLIETSLERGTRQKISEPKTPYIHGIAADPDEHQAHPEEGLPWKSQDFSVNNNQNGDGNGRNLFSLDGAERVRSQLEHYQLRQQDQGGLEVPAPPQDPEEWQTSASEISAGEESASSGNVKKRDEFAQRRQQHYKMKEALLLGKKLLSSDTGEDDDEDLADIDTKNHRNAIKDSDDDMSLEDSDGQVTDSDTGYMEEDEDESKPRPLKPQTKHKKKLKHALKIKVSHNHHSHHQHTVPPLPKQVQQTSSQAAAPYCSSADADDERSPWPHNNNAVTSNTE